MANKYNSVNTGRIVEHCMSAARYERNDVLATTSTDPCCRGFPKNRPMGLLSAFFINWPICIQTDAVIVLAIPHCNTRTPYFVL